MFLSFSIFWLQHQCQNILAAIQHWFYCALLHFKESSFATQRMLDFKLPFLIQLFFLELSKFVIIPFIDMNCEQLYKPYIYIYIHFLRKLVQVFKYMLFLLVLVKVTELNESDFHKPITYMVEETRMDGVMIFISSNARFYILFIQLSAGHYFCRTINATLCCHFLRIISNCAIIL